MPEESALLDEISRPMVFFRSITAICFSIASGSSSGIPTLWDGWSDAMASEATEFPVPVDGCWVSRSDSPERTGVVLATKRINGTAEIHVRWHKTKQDSWVSHKEIRSGFQLGMEVQEVP